MSHLQYKRCSGDELRRSAERALELLSPCRLCPRECGADRLADQEGFCGSGSQPKVASTNLHFGEEPPISGRGGSGTVFFSGCNLHCIYCQNYPISQMRHGRVLSPEQLAERMLDLQRRGAENINLVTAMHFVPQVLQSLAAARDRGLSIPVVYNTNAYEKVETLRLLEGAVDVYLPDIKYASDQAAQDLSQAPRYWEIATAAVREMFRQVGGNLVLDARGMALRGLVVRHLLLPGGLDGAEQVFRFVDRELSPEVRVSIMTQYFPTYRALECDKMKRKINSREVEEALSRYCDSNLNQCFFQEHGRD